MTPDEVKAVFARAREALAEGRITSAEHDYLLTQSFGTTDEASALRKLAPAGSWPYALAALILAFALLGAFLLFGGGGALTGFVSLEPSDSLPAGGGLLLTEQTTLPLEVSNITGLTVSGSLVNGSAEVYLVYGEERLLVYAGEAVAPQYSVSTDKSSYALGVVVDVEVVPSDSSYTLWLTSPSGEKSLVEYGFVPAGPGVHSLDALINDSGAVEKVSIGFTVREDADPANDVLRQTSPPSSSFVDACAGTCAIPFTGDAPLSLEATVSPGAELRIDSIMASVPRGNAPPTAVAPIPDIALAEGGEVTLDLSSYFSDLDGDNLTFDFMSVPGVEMSIEGSVLRVAGVAESSQQSLVYASDLYSITASNAFTITVAPGVVVLNETNETNATDANLTTNITDVNITEDNTTVDANLTEVIDPLNATEENATINLTLDCSNPDPNQRPLECLQAEADIYFQEQTILITSNTLVPVARITPIGNLLLKGDYYELSAGAPGRDDYAITYEDALGDRRSTVWFETVTGDLRLSGRLYEENANLVAPPGSYVLRNKRGIVLAWADPASGDLYIRGNVFPYHKSMREMQ